MELLACLYAYSATHRNPRQLDPSNPSSIVSTLKKLYLDNIVADNAPIIYEIERNRQGGDPIESITPTWVDKAVTHHQNNSPQDHRLANLLQNAARYLCYFGVEESANKNRALDWLEKAIMLYDPQSQYVELLEKMPKENMRVFIETNPNIHHIAGAFFRKSEVFLAFSDHYAAKENAETSLKLWDALVTIFPKNEHYKSSYNKTQEWLKSVNEQILKLYM